MGGEGSKARGEKLDAGIWAGYNTNKSQRVAPFDTKEANDDFIRRSWGQKPFEEEQAQPWERAGEPPHVHAAAPAGSFLPVT